LVQEISLASNEQNSGADEINRALQQLDSTVQRSAGAAEELSAAADGLLNMSQEQSKTMSFFTLPNNAIVTERRNHSSVGGALRTSSAEGSNSNDDDECVGY